MGNHTVNSGAEAEKGLKVVKDMSREERDDLFKQAHNRSDVTVKDTRGDKYHVKKNTFGTFDITKKDK